MNSPYVGLAGGMSKKGYISSVIPEEPPHKGKPPAKSKLNAKNWKEPTRNAVAL